MASAFLICLGSRDTGQAASVNDKIYMRDLEIHCIIGTNAWERENKQTVIINIEMDCDLRLSGKSDRLEDTIDYRLLRDNIFSAVETSAYFLIERLAEVVAGTCLENPRVQAVTVSVDKPGALTGTHSVAVGIHRGRS